MGRRTSGLYVCANVEKCRGSFKGNRIEEKGSGSCTGDSAGVFQKETCDFLKENHIKVWCNSLSLAKRLVYGAGYDDLKSLRYGGDHGWGVLINRGVNIIQTDWPYELKQYLIKKEAQ